MITLIKDIIPQDTKKLVSELPKKSQTLAKYLCLYEDEKYLAPVRFSQDTAVNWVPKAVLTRSMADFSEMSFLEFAENFLVYFAGDFLKKNIFEKLVLKNANKEVKANVKKSAIELMKDENGKKVLPLKAALAVCGLIIPIAEYSLNYIKNIFTLKLFKQADFNNIANLNKNKSEDSQKQQAVKESAIKHLKLSLAILGGCFAFAALLAIRGKNSKVCQKISEYILDPGHKLFKAKFDTKEAIEIAERKASKFNKYFGLDSTKLCRGQLTTCVVAGFFGYMGAAKDRGKQNMLEVLFRYPIVTFYVITGSELFEKAYTKFLRKKNDCKELLDEKELSKDKEVPKFIGLKSLAEKYANTNGTTVEHEFKKLFKQKTKIVGVPFLFSLIFMGFFVATYSRFFTQYRYKKEQQNLDKFNDSKSVTNERSKL